MRLRDDVQKRIDDGHAAVLREWLGQIPGDDLTEGAAAISDELAITADAMAVRVFLLPMAAGVVRFMETHAAVIDAAGWEWFHGRDMNGRWLAFERKAAADEN